MVRAHKFSKGNSKSLLTKKIEKNFISDLEPAQTKENKEKLWNLVANKKSKKILTSFKV